MDISVIGTGYVGLVSGVCLAEKGHRVICVDNDAAKVARISRGESPIYEEGLDDLLTRHIGSRVEATTDLKRAVEETRLTLIAVGTPFDGEAIDLRYVQQVAREIGTALKDKDAYHVVVVKSTVIPGTTDDVVLPILEEHSGKRAGRDFGLGMNPEFLREGSAIRDFLEPDRIVLGGIDETTRNVLGQVYEPFAGVDMLRTNNRTAEMIKYSANSLLATLISFSNEIGNLCARIGGVDVVEVMRGVHLDKRLSPISGDGQRIMPDITTYLAAGCGFGGSCFPKDVKALIAHGKQLGLGMDLLEAVIDVNQRQPFQVLELARKHVADFSGVSFGILGLAFKPGTDDMRESPAIPVIRELLAQGGRVAAYDPVARHEAEKIFPAHQVRYCDSIRETVQDADVVLLLTRWDLFDQVPQLLGEMTDPPVLIDGRRMLHREDVPRYEGIGLS